MKVHYLFRYILFLTKQAEVITILICSSSLITFFTPLNHKLFGYNYINRQSIINTGLLESMWSTYTLLNLSGEDKYDAVETVTNHIYLNVAVSTIYKKLIGVMILFEKRKKKIKIINLMLRCPGIFNTEEEITYENIFQLNFFHMLFSLSYCYYYFFMEIVVSFNNYNSFSFFKKCPVEHFSFLILL